MRDLDAFVRWYAIVFDAEPVYRGIDTSLDGSSSTSFAVFVLAGLKVFLSEDATAHIPAADSPTLVFMTPKPLGPLRRTIERRGAIFDDEKVSEGFPTDADGVRGVATPSSCGSTTRTETKMEFCRVLKRD
ncbi:hypothetical protein ACKUT9_22625 [Mycobacterium seoulense]|uniref:hypothetical protein n=1 Tax=Mycobacterium seoulense TaxID=386911 RepID=UPI003CF9235B